MEYILDFSFSLLPSSLSNPFLTCSRISQLFLSVCSSFSSIGAKVLGSLTGQCPCGITTQFKPQERSSLAFSQLEEQEEKKLKQRSWMSQPIGFAVKISRSWDELEDSNESCSSAVQTANRWISVSTPCWLHSLITSCYFFLILSGTCLSFCLWSHK